MTDHVHHGEWCQACVEHGRELERPPADEYSVPELLEHRRGAESRLVATTGVLARIRELIDQAVPR